MLTIIITVLVTALLTSITTLALGHYFFEKKIKVDLEHKIEARIDQLGDTIEERVRQGIISGVASIPSREVIKGTTRTMAKTGAEIVEDSLNTILGKRSPRKNDRR